MGRDRRCPVLAAVLLLLMVTTAFAGGPRWVAGAPYFSSSVAGNAVVWGTTNLRYSTDPGDLSVSVNHAAADALVATAAASWNVSVSAMVVSQAGVLGEDVNGSNVFMGASGPVFPADVQASNAASIPVAVIYDADGAVTDTLLGGGASDPGNCRQTAVTESVDGITSAGEITHALLVVNGRCTGAAPEMQKELTYRLVRAFGRILGVGWSQLNENVFTGTPQPTAAQAMHWPVMHPIDVMCGPYAYQCLPQPLVLRPDDIATMVSMYPESGADAGKTYSFQSAAPISGNLTFPNGQGMAGVNLVEHRFNISALVMDMFEETSAVTGYRFQRQGATPVAAKGTSVEGSQGYLYNPYEGRYDLPWIPLEQTWYENVYITAEPVNPLYVGQYGVGPYGGLAQVTPSGSVVNWMTTIGSTRYAATVNIGVTNAVAACTAAGDGTEAAPVSVDPSGTWQGAMCGYAHTAWSKLAVKAGRTLTVELTALDEQGLATTGKMQPIFGVWAGTDGTGTLPTVASASTPLNTATLGMTALTIVNPSARALRMGFGDARGDGRPDYAYKARVLYADTVTPAVVPASGGVITITGMGFRSGNAVTVNGVAATVTSWSANTIVAVAPAMVGPIAAADVTVTDLSTAGTTTIGGGVAYSGTVLPNVLSVVSVPPDGSLLGIATSASFAVKVLLADGVSPAAGVGVTVSATHGAVLMGCGGASGCTLTTDPAGMVKTAVMPSLGGTVALAAAVGVATATASFVAGSRAADVLRVTSLPAGLAYVGIAAGLPLIVQAMLGDGVTPDAGAQVSLAAAGAGLGGCGGASSCVLTADGLGLVATTVIPHAPGMVSLQATAGGGSVSASFGAVAMPADVLRVVSAPGNGATMGTAAAQVFQVQTILGDGVTPAAGAAVALTAAGAAFTACGGASSCVLTADAAGMVTSGVIPGLATGATGSVTLTAAAGGGRVQTAFTTTAPLPDRLEVMSVPASFALAGAAAPGAFSVRLVRGDGTTPVVGAAVTLTVAGGVLGVCGAVACVVKTDTAGLVATAVTASAAGTVGLGATAEGLSVTTSFAAVADTLRLVAVPLGPSYAGVPTTSPVTMQVIGPDGATPAAGAAVTMTTSIGTLMACGLPTCGMTADAQGMVSTLVLPVAPGVVSIYATAGGGSLGTSFSVLPMPPDILKVVSVPSGKVYVGVPAANQYTLQVLRGDGLTPEPKVVVILQSPQATLSPLCGTVCGKTSDVNGRITVAVTPLVSGTNTIQAFMLYGGQATSTFSVLPMPPNTLTVTSTPANGSAEGKVAAAPFAVQVMMGDGRTPSANAAALLTATGGVLGACGAASCHVTTDAQGMVSTTVTPTVVGTILLAASSGGSATQTTFTSALSPDVLTVVSAPSNGAMAGSPASLPFAVKTVRWDGTAAAGEAVTLTAVGGTLGACGLAMCVVTADASGMVSTAVTPTAIGTVGLAAAAVGGTATASFTATSLPPDVLTVHAIPASGGYPGRVAHGAFRVAAVLWDGTVAAGAAVTVTATNGILAACGAASCVLTADASGVVSTAVTPVAAGLVVLTASAGGGSVSASLTAVAMPPDVLSLVSVPGSGGYVGVAASGAFAVKVVLGDGTPGAGAAVTITASGGTLACGGALCVLTADATGVVSTAVTPAIVGTVGLTASAGGGAVSGSFTAVAAPVDVLTVLSMPGNGAYVGDVAAMPLRIKVFLGDGVTTAAGVPVTLTATGASLGACGTSLCVMTADSGGMVSTTVTPFSTGTVALRASAGGGVVAVSFTAVEHLRAVTMLRAVEYVAPGAVVNWAPQAIATVDGVPVAEPVNWTFGVGMATAPNGASLGPLPAGATASGTACAWGNVCSTFSAVAVDEAVWQIAVVSGGGQVSAVGGAFDPVVARVVDGAGHGIAGAVVAVRQAVHGYVSCPDTGRCPVGPLLQTSTATATTDADGLIQVTPLMAVGEGETTGIVLTAGDHGFLSTATSIVP